MLRKPRGRRKGIIERRAHRKEGEKCSLGSGKPMSVGERKWQEQKAGWGWWKCNKRGAWKQWRPARLITSGNEAGCKVAAVLRF